VETQRDVVEFEGAEKALDKSVKAMAILAGISLMWLMVLVCYAVVMRRVFNDPPLGGTDLASVSLVPVVFLGFAYCGWTGGHIAVDIISSLNKPNLTRWTDVIVRILSAVLLGILTWRCIILLQDAMESGEATELIEIPHSPFIGIMIVGSAVFCLTFLVMAVRAWRGQPDANSP
jgi:TRAP-type C4-dicarboxylate transport system permease small subunit